MRDKERIQTFHDKIIVRKELPFANVRNAAFLNCMNFNDSIKTELSETKTKLRKTVELCNTMTEQSKQQIEAVQHKNFALEQRVVELQNELSAVKPNENKIAELENKLLQNESDKSTLNQRIQDLQDQLTTSQVRDNEVQMLQNKIISLEKDVETARMCFNEMNKRLNGDLIQCEKEKQQYQQQVVFEISEKVRFQHLHDTNQEYIRELEYKLDDMEETLRSMPPPQPCQCYTTVPQNPWPQNPVPTFATPQYDAPFPCQPPNTIPQQPLLPPNTQHRGRRRKRGGFY